MIEAVFFPVLVGSQRPQRCPAFPDGFDTIGRIGYAQVSVILPGEGMARQIFCGAGRADRDIIRPELAIIFFYFLTGRLGRRSFGDCLPECGKELFPGPGRAGAFASSSTAVFRRAGRLFCSRCSWKAAAVIQKPAGTLNPSRPRRMRLMAFGPIVLGSTC